LIFAEILQSLCTGAIFLLTFLTLKIRRGANQKASNFLSLFFFGLFLLFLNDLFSSRQVYTAFPEIYGFPIIAFFLLGPALYLAVVFFVDPRKTWKATDFLHFLLLVLFFVCNLPFFFAEEELKLKFVESQNIGDETVTSIFYLLFLLQSIVYGILSIRKLNQHKKNTVKYSAQESEINLNWLKYLVITFLFMVIANTFLGQGDDYLIFWQIHLIFLIAILTLATLSVHQVEIFSSRKDEREALGKVLDTSFENRLEDAIPLNQPSSTLSGINENESTSVGDDTENDENKTRTLMSDEREEELIKLLEFEMEEQQLFLEKELNVLKLADCVSFPAYQVSYAINKKKSMNFSTYVNTYRVKHAKMLLNNSKFDYMNIIQIAYQSGFNSKTAFNTHFKKIVGESPTKYRMSAKSQ